MDDIHPEAKRLNELTKSGRLRDAYSLVQQLTPATASVIALEAGFSVISTRNRDAFWTHMQRELALASKARTDGFGLRDMRLAGSSPFVRQAPDTITSPRREQSR